MEWQIHVKAVHEKPGKQSEENKMRLPPSAVGRDMHVSIEWSKLRRTIIQ